jgi:hypothetical protein
LRRKRINISTVPAGQKLGIKEVDDRIWLASFMHYDLGYFDLEQKTLQPLDNPFGTRFVTHVLGTICYPSVWAGQAKGGGEGGIRTPDRLAPMPHFECGAFNHSATSPVARVICATRGRGVF